MTNPKPKKMKSEIAARWVGISLSIAVIGVPLLALRSCFTSKPKPTTAAELVQQQRQQFLSNARRQCREALEPALARAVGLSPSSISVFTDFASEITKPFGHDEVPLSLSASGQMQIRLPFEGHAGFTCDFEGGRVKRAQFNDVFSKDGLLLKEISPAAGDAASHGSREGRSNP